MNPELAHRNTLFNWGGGGAHLLNGKPLHIKQLLKNGLKAFPKPPPDTKLQGNICAKRLYPIQHPL